MKMFNSVSTELEIKKTSHTSEKTGIKTYIYRAKEKKI